MKIGIVIVLWVMLVLVTISAVALDEVTVQLKWIHQAQFAGFYAAEAQGYYAEEDIDISFEAGGIGIDIFEGVSEGTITFAVVGADSIVDKRSQGMPITAFATLYRINPFVLVAFASSGIASPYDFPGHVVAVTPGYSEAQFAAMLSVVGVDQSSFTVVTYAYDDAAFLAGDIDVTVSFAAGSLLPLKEKIGDQELNVIWPDDYGVHFYSDTLVANDALLAENPDLVLRFLRATLRGHQFAIENPEIAIDATMPYAVVQDRDVQLAMLEASIPLIHTGQDHIGWMAPQIWQDMYDILLNYGLLDEPFDITTAYTLQFLDAIYHED
jgi:NitT/TauT family transport system substrate-binding protein